jgi:AmiR/NasT family two-component response regulator
MANADCVVLFGDFSEEPVDIRQIGSEFSWSVTEAASFREVRAAYYRNPIAAIVIQAHSISAPLQSVLEELAILAPGARLIVSYKAGDAGLLRDIIDSGACGAVMSPLNETELRQTLGFAWAARRNRARIGSCEPAIPLQASAAA